MGFNLESLLAKRRIRADVDSGSPVTVRSETSGRIHTLSRQERVDASQIGRGNAQLRSASGAMCHHPADAIRPRQKLPGQINVTGLNRRPYATTGDNFTGHRDWRHDFERNIGRPAQAAQRVDVSRSTMAKKE